MSEHLPKFNAIIKQFHTEELKRLLSSSAHLQLLHLPLHLLLHLFSASCNNLVLVLCDHQAFWLQAALQLMFYVVFARLEEYLVSLSLVK